MTGELVVHRLKGAFHQYQAGGGKLKEYSSRHEAAGSILLSMRAVEGAILANAPKGVLVSNLVTLAQRALTAHAWMTKGTIDEAAAAVLAEYERAVAIHGDHQNLVEGYAVLLEEVEEFWVAVTHEYQIEFVVAELIQVGAMAVKLLVFLESQETTKIVTLCRLAGFERRRTDWELEPLGLSLQKLAGPSNKYVSCKRGR